MRESFYIQNMQALHDRCQILENKVKSVYNVLEQIIGKELLRGQALHKVLMDKGMFTDAELKSALEVLVEESKAELKKMEETAKEEKAKLELLIPANANLTPPAEAPAPTPVVPTPTQEAPSVEQPSQNQ